MPFPDVETVFDDIDFVAKLITDTSSPADHGRVESIIRSLVIIGRQSVSNPPTRQLAHTVTN
ncbi:hypothetical protein [Aeromonas enteropelogenes]|uniref:hypothetical protein n=1 Tax=Aeromonas enteropelogenes TaxID=29489 RepID=UPI003989321A